MLRQEQDGQLHVIRYASRALSHVERRYCIMHKELLGVVYGLQKYWQHLLGNPSLSTQTMWPLLDLT